MTLLETYYQKILGRFQDEENKFLVLNTDSEIILSCIEDGDVDTTLFWEQIQPDTDPLFVSWASPEHGHGLAWEAARQAVDILSEESLSLEYKDCIPYAGEFVKNWSYLEGKEGVEYEKAFLEASLVLGYIEGYLIPETQEIDAWLLERYQEEVA